MAPLIELKDRPTEMLLRQMQANRNAARDSLHFAHIMPFRPHFVREIIAMRAELRKRYQRTKP